MIWLYRLLFLPGLLVALPYYIYRMWRRGGYAKSFQHRFGLFRRMDAAEPGTIRIWLQAVSVGEVMAIRPLIDALREDPRIEIVLTTTTSTGYAEARKRYKDSVSSIGIFPLDFWLFSRAAWRRIRPDAVILTESELWPEHLHQARRRRVPAYLVNARISDTSFRRYQRVSKLAQRMLTKFREIYAASELDRTRLLALGCPEDRVAMSGSIKFDVSIGERVGREERMALRESLGFGGDGVLILLGSSTWPGEEAVLLDVQNALIAAGVDCRLLLVPRHVERAPDIVRQLKSQNWRWHQRSSANAPHDGIKIHLVDTTGELAYLTQAADLAFVGKSLPPNSGGQTPIEAAGLGVPILMGPNMNNFKDVAKSLQRAGAALTMTDASNLQQSVLQLVSNTEALESMQGAGIAWHKANQGCSQRIALRIVQDLNDALAEQTHLSAEKLAKES